MKTTEQKWPSDPPVATRIARRWPLLASAGLHFALLAALSNLPEIPGPPASAASNTLALTVFTFVREPEAEPSGIVTPETVAPETVAPETVAPETVAPEIVTPEIVTAEVDAAAPERPLERPPRDPRDEKVAATTIPQPNESTPANPAVESTADAALETPTVEAEALTEAAVAEADSTAERAVAERAADAEPAYSRPAAIVTESTAAADDAGARQAHEPSVSPPKGNAQSTEAVTGTPVTEPVAPAESRLLRRRVEKWAASFAAIADWQPETTWSDKGQSYRATVTRIPAADSMDIAEAIVTITTERDGARQSTRMRMRRLGFSHFAQFIDRWDPEVQIHDDVIDGRFHSNSEIYLQHEGGVQPTFTGKVTAAGGINTSRSDRRIRQSDVFLGGLDTRVPRINLPRRISLFDERNDIDPARLHRFAGGTRIVFHRDGSYAWSPIESRHGIEEGNAEATTGLKRLTAEPHYLVAARDAELQLSGTVNGKVLVYSPEAISITGDLVYAEHPATNPASDDYLGLVSDRGVEVAEPEVTGPGDLHVHAAIYAKGRFAVRSYGRSEDATLYIFGSVTAGSLTATEPRFRTKLNFDPRLESTRPPSFPMTDHYEIVDWDKMWRAESPPGQPDQPDQLGQPGQPDPQGQPGQPDQPGP